MIIIVVDRSTSNYAIENQLEAQLRTASSSDSIDIYAADRHVADKAAGYIKACKYKDGTIRTIRYAGPPSPEQVAAAALLSVPSTKPGYAAGLTDTLSGASQPAQLQAHAYAQGSNIFIAPGQERHLPHEAWHVVQQ